MTFTIDRHLASEGTEHAPAGTTGGVVGAVVCGTGWLGCTGAELAMAAVPPMAIATARDNEVRDSGISPVGPLDRRVTEAPADFLRVQNRSGRRPPGFASKGPYGPYAP
ncbi:MAG: hypothetical protein IPH07_21905 [Deltaproteobacteria bacterium]|nr:hypothetical protein [Deltaproteobacteria bacterium]MBK8714376.1 hypothetical protein [Deltaproteobacteria bacterium]MBP7289149.1 hypothetical protein [Nannocystaceae bacterium]